MLLYLNGGTERRARRRRVTFATAGAASRPQVALPNRCVLRHIFSTVDAASLLKSPPYEQLYECRHSHLHLHVIPRLISKQPNEYYRQQAIPKAERLLCKALSEYDLGF